MNKITIKEALQRASFSLKEKVIASRLEAEVLLAWLLQTDRVQLYTRSGAYLFPETWQKYWLLVEERIKGKPLSYITGEKEFMSLTFQVDPQVLIPRPETELLVEHILEKIPENKEQKILDLGTGSGAISVSLAHYNSRCNITAVDISKDALSVAMENAWRHRVTNRINFRQGDLFEPVLDESFDVIASNPPYIADGDLSQLSDCIVNHEPILALKGGPLGLDFYIRIAGKASQHINPGGYMILEIGFGQAAHVTQIFETSFKTELIYDYSSIPRHLIAWPK